ncbi:MAG: thiamine phosphate synthase [Streptosporangiales bacterium]|nr:thiamine phosphate synthase [Streptosporangiales bacterium]
MLPRLLVLTDRRQLPSGRTVAETVARCAEAGLTAVVLRELDLTEARRAGLAADLAEHVRVVSARTLLTRAVGIHLGSRQPRGDAGKAPFHGRSCHDEAEVDRAAAEGTSYVTISPVATSASKPGYGPALGVAEVRRAVAAAAGVPVYALGGVDPGNAAGLREAGAHGVAVMGAVMRTPDPAAMVARLLEEVS